MGPGEALAAIVNGISDAAQDASEAVADGVQSTAESVKNDAVGAAKLVTKVGIKASDYTSTGASYVVAAGVVASPFTKGASLLAVTAPALLVGTAADVISLGFKAVDFLAFGGSLSAVSEQGLVTMANVAGGKLLDRATKRVLVRHASSNLRGWAFRRSAAQGSRHVSDLTGFGITAAADATKVGLGLTTSKIIKKK